MSRADPFRPFTTSEFIQLVGRIVYVRSLNISRTVMLLAIVVANTSLEASLESQP